MAWKSNGVFARRSASRRRRGRLMLELAVVKITSLIFGIGISFAVDPEIAGLDERLVAAIEVDALTRVGGSPIRTSAKVEDGVSCPTPTSVSPASVAASVSGSTADSLVGVAFAADDS